MKKLPVLLIRITSFTFVSKTDMRMNKQSDSLALCDFHFIKFI